jgi:mannosyl-oligosaccharide alpha-1,2-mannosidase
MSRALQRWVLLIVLALILVYYFLHVHSLKIPPSWDLLPSKSRSINWSKVPQQHPVASYTELPTGPSKVLPKVQAEKFAEESDAQKAQRLERLGAVKDVFLQSWNAYKQHAWGHDEFAPVSMAWKDHYGGWGATLVDTLDTLLIMGLDDEFNDAIKTFKPVDFSITHVKTLNVFETTIRFLGGLLSAHELADGKDKGVALKKATELGEMLYHAFDTSNRMPVTRWYWQDTADGLPQEPHPYTLAAELGSMSLEFTRLSQLTGDPKYYDAIQRVSDLLEREQKRTKLPGMWPVIFNAQTQSFEEDGTFSFGGRADSMFEYIPKVRRPYEAARNAFN